MRVNNKKRITVSVITLLLVIFTIGITYAFVSQVLTGSKEVVINAGVLDLVLEEENEITISDALPMHDAVGMIQEDVFVFRLVNKTSNPTNYILKLSKIDADNELSPSDVKYYLTKEGVGEPKLLSSLPTDGTVDSGTIAGSDTIGYTLRFWIDSGVTDESAIAGKALSYRINAEASKEIAKLSLIDQLKLADKVQESTSTFPNFAQISGETNGRGIYKYQEDGEDIYYWRGNIDAVATGENGIGNHIIFGGLCWEMVRTTKTGGVKIIYDGVPVEVDGKKTCPNTGVESQEGVSGFHSVISDNAHVGYMYGLTGVSAELSSPQCIKLNSAGTQAEVGSESTKEECITNGGKWATTAYEATHANVVDSTIKIEVDSWFEYLLDTWFEVSTLNGEENLEKIEDAVYCNDRRIDTVSDYGNGLGYGTNQTFYMASNRFNVNNETSTPDLSCNKNDGFTVSSENGNGDLTYPVGLLTADEIALAGGTAVSQNFDFYLYTGEAYWTLSPTNFGYYAYVFYMEPYGILSAYGSARTTSGVRPVIYLANNITLKSGTAGTVNNPYVVE